MAQSDGTLIFDTKIITDGFKKGLSSLGSVAVKGVGAISAAFAAASGAALKFSGELEQNLGGSEAVFKEYAKSVQTAADTAFKNMGLSASDFLATANKMGALFQGSGFAIAESAELSAKTMQRAADVASIMGIDVSMAMESIAGAAKGNFTMMDNLGVAMNDTTLAAYALEKGVKKSTRAMTNQEKIGLAMQMFLEKTEYAAGNYAKENETLAGSLTTAKAALENFLSGTGDPKDLADSLSDAAEVIIGKLGELTPKLASGLSEVFADLAPMMPSMVNELISGVLDGASELMSSFGDMFAELVTIAAQSGPDMVDAGIQLVESFADGIVDNADEISAAAIRIGEALISAIIEIVPQIVNAAGKITAAFASELGNAYPIIKPFASAVKLLADNLDLCVVAFGAWKGAMLLGNLISFITSGIKTLTATIKSATLAQKLWNAAISSNPIGLAAIAIAGMVTGIYALSKSLERNRSAWDKEKEGIRSQREEINKSIESWKEMQEAQKDAITQSNSQMSHIQNLANELRTLADANGEVTEKNRTRAEFILGQLNQALGTEYTMTDGIIQKYGDLCQSIDELIAKKRAEIILSTKEEAYTTAIGNLESQRKQVSEIGELYNKAISDRRNYIEQRKALETQISEAELNHEDQTKIFALKEQYRDLGLQITETEDKISEYGESLRSATTEMSQTRETIEDYESTYENILSGNYSAVYGSVYDTVTGVTDGTSDALADGQKSIGNEAQKFGDYTISAISDGMKLTIPKTNEALQAFANGLRENLNPAIESARTYGSDLFINLINGQTLKIEDAVQVSEDGASRIVDGLKVEAEVTEKLGSDYIDGIILGIGSRQEALWTICANTMQTAHQYAKAGVRSNSPAKDGIELGEDYIIGVELGIGNEADNLEDIATKSAKRMNKAFADAAKFKIDSIRSDISSITGAIAEESEEKKKAYDAELNRIKMLHDFGIDDEETYYKKREYIRDNYLTKHSDAWIDATQEIYDYQQSILEEQKDLFEDIKDGISDMYDDIAEHAIDKLEEVEKKQNKLAEKLNDSTSLYEKVTINAGDDSMEFYRLNDLSDEKANASAYGDLLNQVVDRVKASSVSEDAIAGVLNQIDELGNDEEGRGILSALLSADEKTFAQRMNDFADVYATNQGTAVQRYSAEMAEAVDESYQYMIDELTKAGFEIPEGFFVSGTLSAEKFGAAFMSELELQMQEIQTKIIDFNTKLGNSLGVGSQNVNNDNRSTTYNIYGDSPSTVSQIKNYETIKRLSGQ